MLSSSAFQALSKADLYQLFTEVYNQRKRKMKLSNVMCYHPKSCYPRQYKKTMEPRGITETSKKIGLFLKVEKGYIFPYQRRKRIFSHWKQSFKKPGERSNITFRYWNSFV